jgi:hypothetical protein
MPNVESVPRLVEGKPCPSCKAIMPAAIPIGKRGGYEAQPSAHNTGPDVQARNDWNASESGKCGQRNRSVGPTVLPS